MPPRPPPMPPCLLGGSPFSHMSTSWASAVSSSHQNDLILLFYIRTCFVVLTATRLLFINLIIKNSSSNQQATSKKRFKMRSILLFVAGFIASSDAFAPSDISTRHVPSNNIGSRGVKRSRHQSSTSLAAIDERKPWQLFRFISQSSKFVTLPSLPFASKSPVTKKIGVGEFCLLYHYSLKNTKPLY